MNRKLQCRLCGTEIDEDRHSGCEHSNSMYELKEKMYDKIRFTMRPNKHTLIREIRIVQTALEEFMK
jgi:hypothetical protein